MSIEEQKVSTLKKITPILQSLLIEQIKSVLEALNARAYIDVWLRLRNLLLASPPSVKKEVMPEFEKLQTQINQAGYIRAIDFYVQKSNQQAYIQRVLQDNVLRLFETVMEKLYEKGYLDLHREFLDGTLT